MSYAQYLRQLLAPLGVYQLNAPFQGGELEALGDAFDQVEGALEELNREACLATAEDWGLEQVAALFRRRPPATTVKTMREALAALLRIGGDSFTLAAINDTLSGCGVNARVEETDQAGTVEVSFPQVPGIPPNFDPGHHRGHHSRPLNYPVPLLVPDLAAAGAEILLLAGH